MVEVKVTTTGIRATTGSVCEGRRILRAEGVTAEVAVRVSVSVSVSVSVPCGGISGERRIMEILAVNALSRRSEERL